jgi:WD40 repeat protein/tetratricopeptide (TPR) repeat protein
MKGAHSRPDPSRLDRERRLDEAIAEYLVAAEAGRAPDRGQFLARYPDLADDLAEFIDDEACIRGLAGTAPMSEAGDGGTPRGGGAAAGPDRPGVGGEFGDFELLEEIASGGMGVVFKARQRSLNRIVALKTIRPSALGPGDDAARRFRVEAEAVARLDHPAIVPIFEMGELAGYPFLCLKLIEGGDLDRRLDRFRRDPAAAARLMAVVARAVHYAHQRGVLHRDLKPSNILLDEQGRPHVTDFGLARCVEDDSRITRTGLILGTPSYMAPEQVTGPRDAVTTAADVYGLGAVLYALLAGRPPFGGDSVCEILQRVREQEPASPSTWSPGVDRDLEAICLKCLEKDPSGRYRSAEAMAADLERWLPGEPTEARPTGRAERAWRWYRRNRLVANLAAGVVALILGSAAFAGIMAVGYYRQAGAARSAARVAGQARDLADARAEEVRKKLVRIAVDRGVHLLDQGDTTGALPWFAEALTYDRDDPEASATHRLRMGTVLDGCPSLVGIFSDGRPITWATFDLTGRRVATASADGTAQVWDIANGRALTPELVHKGPVNRAEFRFDGGRLVTASEDGALRVWELDGESPPTGPALRMEHGAPVRFALFSQDGRRVISAGADGKLRCWDATDGRPVGIARTIGSPPLDLTVSSDGGRLATASKDGIARLWRIEGGRLTASRNLPHPRVRRLGFSPDGARVATASEAGTARTWDAATGEPISAPIAHGRWVSQVEFSPDGTLLATASEDGTARVWDARTGRPHGAEGAAMRHATGVGEVAFSPDGARVVTAGLDGMARIWDLASATPLSPPFYHAGSARRARFAPDGYHLLTFGSDDTVRLWDVSRLGGSAVEIEDPDGVQSAAFAPDGRWVATADDGGMARVWDTATGGPISPPMKYRKGIARVVFSPDGRLVAAASVDGTARVWDARTGRPATDPLAHNGDLGDIRFSPDGKLVATASADRRARLWVIGTGRLAVPPMVHDGPVLRVAFSPDGRRLASASEDGTMRIWEVATGRAVLPPLQDRSRVNDVTFSPDGRFLLAAYSDSTFAELHAQQWDVGTGRPHGPPLRHHDGVLSVAYSPDGRRIATASEDRTARVWDSSGEPLTQPLSHQHQVLVAVFSPDGRRLATGSLDGTARVWDVATGEPLSPPLLHKDRTKVGSVAFSPDGRRLVTSGLEGTARIWDLPPDNRPVDLIVRQAQLLAGRRLDRTDAEIALSASELSDAWRRLHDPWAGPRPAAPRSLIAWHRREARRLEASHQDAAAGWHLARLLPLQPGDPSLAIRLSAAYEAAGDWPAVERSASLAIEGGSVEVAVRIRRGWARVHLGRPADAEADFRDALKCQPGSATVRLALFATAAERGEREEADALWRDMIHASEETRPARWIEICNHLGGLESTSPRKWWLHRALAHAMLQAGNSENAEVEYGRALKVDPEDGWSYLGRGLTRKKFRRREEAAADFARSAELLPHIAEPWGAIGESEGLRGRWDEAARAFARWAELGGEPHAFSWFDHAALRLHARDRDGYRRACRALWERFGRTQDLYVASIAARACSLSPDCGVPADRVIEMARLGVREHPRDGWYLSTLGAALLRAGRFDEAVARFEEALRVDPGWIGAPLTEAYRELALRTRAPRGPQARTESQMDFSKLMSRMGKAKAPWNFGLEAELLVREHDEGPPPREKPPS